MPSNQYNIDAGIAYFVSPHGFGHAARACAVVQVLHQLLPRLHCHIFTTAPKWFFADSLVDGWTYHRCITDVGMAQKTALQEDVDATLNQLEQFIPFNNQHVAHLAAKIRALNVKLILCDISPLGLRVAAQAGMPGVLIENFTWDWIYAGYAAKIEKFSRYIDYLRESFSLAKYHIRTAPFCGVEDADLITAPVSRLPRNARSVIRGLLGVRNDQRVILITMGGIPDKRDYSVLQRLYPEIMFVIPASAPREMRIGNIIYLPHHHAYYHPDLVTACDAVVGKVGYSTIAETYWAGVPLGYIPRGDFRESAALVDFIKANMPGLEIPQPEFESGDWYKYIRDLILLDRLDRSGENGAGQIVNFLASRNLIEFDT